MHRRDWLRGIGLYSLALGAGGGCDLGGSSVPDLIWGIHGNKAGWLQKPRVAADSLEPAAEVVA